MRILRRLSDFVRGGQFTRAVATVALGTGAAQGIVIVSSPILTRLFGPTDYGAFAVGTSLLAVLLAITCLRYEYAIPLPPDEKSAANVLALALLANVVTSAVAAVALAVGGSPVLAMFGAASLSPYVLVISIGQFAGGAANALTNWAVRTRSFTDMAASRLVQAAGLVGVQVSLGLLGAGAFGLLLGDAAGRLAAAATLARSVSRRHSEAFRGVSRAGIAAAAGRFRRFPMFSSWSALLATLGLQAPLLFIAAFYGPDPGGQYALAARICAIPLVLIATSVGQVFTAEAAQTARSDAAAIPPLLGRTTWWLAKVALVPALLAMVAAPVLAGPIFGPGWEATGLFIAVLIPSYVAEFVTSATGDLLYVLERQDLHLWREVLRFGLIGGAVPAAAMLGMPPLGAIILLSAAGIVNYAIYGAITWRAAVAHRSHSQSPQLVRSASDANADADADADTNG